ncbi:hypothetical protein M514_03719 [Trichuris suis]|uniref:Uncharacterized protein n=1 Tax=Trichuris suis TaxID=68888 RepID=A0A085MDT3_9BILA|nr:hypothetical protein M513_03719 [Trichuris suis]KFD68702.1 hypothetical protein M514_03719 [Trichuris suis]
MIRQDAEEKAEICNCHGDEKVTSLGGHGRSSECKQNQDVPYDSHNEDEREDKATNNHGCL